MDETTLLAHVARLLQKLRPNDTIYGVHSEVCELLESAVGPKSAYLAAIKDVDPRRVNADYSAKIMQHNLTALTASIEAGARAGISPKRQAELDVVSDFLGMAHDLLESNSVHPAAPAVLIGATLEEFLRNWVEEEGLSLGSRKSGIEAYSQVLRDAQLISKQDGKDITSWAGTRNHAAHGEWDVVADRNRIRLMLEGVNLFIRRHTSK